jgi:hypothetical protein
MHRRRTMSKHKLGFVALDSAKGKHAVAIADDGRDGEVRYLGENDSSPDAVRKLVAKLSRRMSACIFVTRFDQRGMVADVHRHLRKKSHTLRCPLKDLPVSIGRRMPNGATVFRLRA